MAEYIEREYAVDAVVDVYYDTPDINLSCEKFEAAIIKIPAADVVTVRHGRWVDKPLIKSFKNTNIPVVECSACGIDFCDIINNHYFMYKYCPNCGAKMDGGAE